MQLNLDCSAGVRMGLEFECTIAEIIGLGLGMHGDMFCLHLEEGMLSYGQEYSSGAAITAFFHNFGFVESAYNKYFEYMPTEVSKGFYGDETLTIASGAFYFGVGAHFRIGFDIVQFCKDLDEVFGGR